MVSRVKIMEFAESIGDPNPVYRDLAAARLAGYCDVIAPPTFAGVVVVPASIAAARKVLRNLLPDHRARGTGPGNPAPG